MSNPTGPPPVAGYFRQNAYGNPDKLQALADGYFGLNLVVATGVMLLIGSNAVLGRIPWPLNYAVIFMLSFLVTVFVSYPQTKKIGYGLGWPPGEPAIVSVLMGLIAFPFCGIIGYVVVQRIACKGMLKYGVPTGFFGAKKNDIDAVLQSLRGGASPIPPQP